MGLIKAKASDSYSLSEIHQILRNNGSRVTPQRECILDTFFQMGEDCHLSVEDIHRILTREKHINIALATVYRTVKTLFNLGILREIDLAEGHKHYELSSLNNHHHHIVCMNCNKTIEFADEQINSLAHKIAEQYNIRVRDVELKIYGDCLDEEHHPEPKASKLLWHVAHRR